ncbi:sulfatase-like hydrolase/transferase [Verrucomicrobia bacterium]|nr:sulfatase-like hydrolase/transferase [Verrucomicrobiota bacterium]
MSYRSSLLGRAFVWMSLLVIGFSVAAARSKPNIIMIMADDVSWEAFSCYGAVDYKTPHIDRLASQGIRFNHAYSTPICTPTRNKIMTGKYNFRNYTHFGYLNPKEKTFGNLLQDAGYQTAIAGKWQLNGLYNSLEGSMDSTRPNKAGFHEYCLWQLTKGKNVKQGGGERFWSPPLEQNGKMLTIEDHKDQYGPDIMSDFLCDFIDRNQKKPFFVYYPMVLVHDPFVPTPDTIGDGSRGHETNKAPKGKEAKKANFVAMVQYMDKIIGKIAKKVADVGQAENTLILFTADNGTNTGITSEWNGQQIKGGKGGMKDMGTHVPLVAYWPGTTPKGGVSDDLIDFTDFYTTFADAAGIKLGKSDPIDGRSFLPQLHGKKGNPRDWVFMHYQSYWGQQPGQYARTGNYKLYRDGRYFEVPKDLNEATDLSQMEHSARSEKVRKRLEKFLATTPPAQNVKKKRDATDRPTYEEWHNLFD